MNKKIAFKTLGCRLNQYETDAIASDFSKERYSITDFSDKADVYVINTCTVTNQSDHKSRNIISQASRKNPDAVVVVTGCMANHYKEQLEKKGNITYVIENKKKSSIYSLIDAHFKGEIIQPESLKEDVFGYHTAKDTFHTRSMIKIQDGCDNFCTFCIIPTVRGRAISRPADDILHNIKEIISLGYKEVVLTGVNIGRYDHEGTDFTRLVKKVLELPGNFRVRISSIEPDGFGDEFFALFKHPKMTPHLHLCLQSGSDKILLQMRRMYTVSSYRKMAENIKKHVSGFNLTTDVIVGFPGETEEDFNDTCNFIKEIGFSHIHTFKYSVRKGTRAERMPNQVSEKVKNERSEIIRKIAEGNKYQYRKSFIGKTQDVLVEKIHPDGTAEGYGEHYIPVKIIDSRVEKNTFVHTIIRDVEKGEDPYLIGTSTEG